MPIIFGLLALAGGFGASYALLKGKTLIDIEKNQAKADKLIEDSSVEAEKILREAEENLEAIKKGMQTREEQGEELVKKIESSIELKEGIFSKKEEKIQELKDALKEGEKDLKTLETKSDEFENQLKDTIAKKAGIDVKKAKEQLIDKFCRDLEHTKGEKLQKVEEKVKETAAKEAERIVVNAIQRLSSATSVERRMINVNVPKDKFKGKLVGKGGKNIQYFEAALDVDIIFNDQPNTISISAFNLVNRKIAEEAIKIMIKEDDGKNEITEKTMDAAIAKGSRKMDEELLVLGRQGAEQIGIFSDDEELLKIIGRLQYRTSYGQNIMLHSLEVGWLAIMLGGEIWLNLETLKKGGFLHDVGKAIDQNADVQGTHDYLTKQIMEAHNFSWEEVHAAWTHHDAEPQATPEAMIVKAADAISASRPGARQESMTKYIQRLKDLEGTAGSFAGVKKAFAISAGRELRVIVDPIDVKDFDVQGLAEAIAKEIEADDEITYPGHVLINVIRKTKSVDVAKQKSYN